jgi:hypothetical protein
MEVLVLEGARRDVWRLKSYQEKLHGDLRDSKVPGKRTEARLSCWFGALLLMTQAKGSEALCELQKLQRLEIGCKPTQRSHTSRKCFGIDPFFQVDVDLHFFLQFHAKPESVYKLCLLNALPSGQVHGVCSTKAVLYEDVRCTDSLTTKENVFAIQGR